ncbi:hypothetical protein AV530_012588 [Patagioenas fasciata monilis]|uniref:Uncharacterized protein n=1 Tax=Patagioenas fasciata monilis TaxID=372326 RepID=A0A1V4JBU2_PATFA|nr:hypothetical protein AV530_012588 [Patagioenas fasciata monilis]
MCVKTLWGTQSMGGRFVISHGAVFKGERFLLSTSHLAPKLRDAQKLKCSVQYLLALLQYQCSSFSW